MRALLAFRLHSHDHQDDEDATSHTLARGPAGIRLKVGRGLVGEDARVLNRECLRSLEKKGRLSVDVSEVRLVDCWGRAILSPLRARRVRLIGCSQILASLVEGYEKRGATP